MSVIPRAARDLLLNMGGTGSKNQIPRGVYPYRARKDRGGYMALLKALELMPRASKRDISDAVFAQKRAKTMQNSLI